MFGKIRRNSSCLGSAAGTLTAWLALSMPGCATVDGALKLHGGPLGELEFKPGSCKSGQHYNFLGADLFAANKKSSPSEASAQQPTFRVVNGVVLKDPVAANSDEDPGKGGKLRIINDVVHGPVVRYFDPRLTGGYLQFTPELCKRLTVDAENTESMYRSHALYVATSGSMRLQCELPDGTSASGVLSFEGCQ